MGRSPCCDKIGLKKGPWTPEEDQKLLAYIEEHGHGSWRALPIKAGLQRCGKSCRLRWTNYLRPDIKRGKFSLQEEQTIIQLHALLGNRWSAIATHLAKRTDNEIKNYWNTHLKKRLAKMGIDPVTHKPKNDALLSNNQLVDGGAGQSKSAANLSHMAQWESARLEAEARLVRQSNLRTTLNNSFQTQQQSGAEFESTSSQIHKPGGGPDLCLDVLKAWSGGGGAWTNMRETAAAGGSGELESPTSTLSSAAAGGNGNVDSNSIPHLPMESIETTRESFVENFTDLLLSNSRKMSEDGGESDNSGVDGGGGGYYEDNKNYWNSILNLVNASSPSDDSPIF